MAKLQGRRGEALAVQSAASCAIGGVISGFPFFSVERHINVTLGWIWHNTLHIEYKKYACLFSASLCFTLPSFCPPTHTTPVRFVNCRTTQHPLLLARRRWHRPRRHIDRQRSRWLLLQVHGDWGPCRKTNRFEKGKEWWSFLWMYCGGA